MGELLHQVRNPTSPNTSLDRAFRPPPTPLNTSAYGVVIGGRMVPIPLPALKRVVPTPDTIFFATVVITCGDLFLTSCLPELGESSSSTGMSLPML